MSNTKKDLTTPGQLLLPFFHTSETPNYHIHSLIKDAISESLKKCRNSRHQVAAKMSEVLNTDITKSQLDSWSAESKEFHRIPAEYVPAFCYASENNLLLKVIVTPVKGVQLIENKDAIKLEITKLNDEIKRIRDQKRYLEERLK